MPQHSLDFEKPIDLLREKIDALRHMRDDAGINIADEIRRLEDRCHELMRHTFKHLSAWQITQLARHPMRPHASDYIKAMFTDFDELHGDRAFKDDRAILAGLARLDGKPVMVVGQEKGRETKGRIAHNFGMPHPEGYRRALRLFKLAERYQIPVITIIDTPGAYPSIDAEARGQSEAIARNLLEMAQLRTPIICAVIGEGCSGGALGIGVGDHTMMMQYAYYATISPEGCASILWKSSSKAQEAAATMGITAEVLLQRGLIDSIVEEPLGGAHRDPQLAASFLKTALLTQLRPLKQKTPDQLVADRYQRLVKIGRERE
ncbi:MAG: acetyl-CoA carboxylase carboxyltransferase subunit alpha [Pseudomonadota bacterium]